MVGMAVGDEDRCQLDTGAGHRLDDLPGVTAGINDKTRARLTVINEVTVGLQGPHGNSYKPGAYVCSSNRKSASCIRYVSFQTAKANKNSAGWASSTSVITLLLAVTVALLHDRRSRWRRQKRPRRPTPIFPCSRKQWPDFHLPLPGHPPWRVRRRRRRGR